MKTKVLRSTEIDKKVWDEFVGQSPQGSIFALSAYLDIIAPKWSAVIVFDDHERITAALPLTTSSKFSIKYAAQPILAKYLGLMFGNGGDKTVYNEYHYKSKFAKLIIDHIPVSIRYFSYNFSPAFDYPVPFHWAGFVLEPKYTYYLDISKSCEEIRSHFKNSLRNKLSGFNSGNFTVDINKDFEEHEKVFGTRFTYRDFNITDEYFRKLKEIYEVFMPRDMARFYSIRSQGGETAASILFLYFRKTIYFYLGLLNPEFKEFPVKPYLINREIERCCQQFDTFDFQGSMIPGVESFVRSFGASPVHYLNISKKRFPLNLV